MDQQDSIQRLAVIRHEHYAFCLDCQEDWDDLSWADTKAAYQAHALEKDHRVVVHRQDIIGVLEPFSAWLLRLVIAFSGGGRRN